MGGRAKGKGRQMTCVRFDQYEMNFVESLPINEVAIVQIPRT